MAQFLYFVPDKQRLTLEQCKELGLGYAFESNPSRRPVASGPDGQRGAILCANDERIGYHSDKQTWRKTPKNTANAWCGVWQDAAPTPDDLKRPHQLGGKWLTFENGTKWLVPFARRFYEFEDDMHPVCELPRMLDVDDDGKDPYGKSFTKPKDWTSIWEPDKDRAKIIQWMFRECSKPGSNAYAVLRTLNRRGVPSPRGATWHPNQTTRILSNRAYVGEYTFGRRASGKLSQVSDTGEVVSADVMRVSQSAPIIIPDHHEAIVDLDTFNAVQSTLRSGTSSSPWSRARLGGLLWCAHCGSRLYSLRSTTRGGEPSRYYKCYGGSLGCADATVSRRQSWSGFWRK